MDTPARHIGTPAGCAEWRQAKLKQLAAGHTTAFDRREARRIRKREAEGFLTTPAQQHFATLVETAESRLPLAVATPMVSNDADLPARKCPACKRN